MEGLPKQYLYHRVPEKIEETEGKKVIYPRNILKEKFPGLYEVTGEKYETSEKRKSIPDRIIPILENATWSDVVQMTAVHPQQIVDALQSAGYTPKEMKFYQIDPEMLDPKKTAIYLYRENEGDADGARDYQPFEKEHLQKHSVLPEKTKDYYREQFNKGERPLLFVGVPHIFHKGPIDVSNFPVITAEATEK